MCTVSDLFATFLIIFGSIFTVALAGVTLYELFAKPKHEEKPPCP